MKIISAFLLIAAVLMNSGPVLASSDFKVVVSVKPIHSIVSSLMKNIGTPTLLIDDQETPYTYQPTEQHLQQLQQANLVFWVGPELESGLQTTLKKLPESVHVVEFLSSPNLKILPSRGDYSQRDPFFWMDDRNMMILLDDLTEILIDRDLNRAHIYERNRRELLSELKRIDREYEYGYRGMKAGIGVQYFDTLQYFEQAYALKNLGRVAGSPYQQEQVTDLLNVRGRIVNGDATCLFVDRSMPAEHLDILTDKQSINVGLLDTLGKQFTPGPSLYIKLMNHNTDVIKNCLNADMNKAAEAREKAHRDDTRLFTGVGGRFILTDHLGDTVTEQDIKGKFSILFFGYTSCPDICPTSLLVLTQAFKALGEDANLIKPYFISVDPERDKVNVLKQYVGYFDHRLTGLTGSTSMIKRVADQFKVKYEKGEKDDHDPSQYAVDHTSSLFLLAPDGSFITKFAHGITSDTLVQELRGIIR